MGYTTKLEGAFTVEPSLSGIHFAYLERFIDQGVIRVVDSVVMTRELLWT